MEQQSNKVKQELLPGQKYPTPTRGFGDRVFYESLLRQRPDSIMAQEWCVYHGVLDKDEAQKLYNLLLKRKGKNANGSPQRDVKSSPSKQVIKMKRKRRVSEMGEEKVEFDAEMDVGGYEGIGSSMI